MAVYKQSKKNKQLQFDTVKMKTKFITDEDKNFREYFRKKKKISAFTILLLVSIAVNIICYFALFALLLIPYYLKINASAEYVENVVNVLAYPVCYMPIINFVFGIIWILSKLKAYNLREFTSKDAVNRMLFSSYEYVEFSDDGVFITFVESVRHEGSAGELRRRVLYAKDTIKAAHSSELGMTVIYGDVYEFMVTGLEYAEREYNDLDWKYDNNRYGKIIALSDSFENQENGSFDIGRQISESLNVTPLETDVRGMIDFIMLYEGKGFGLEDRKIKNEKLSEYQ